MVWSLIGPRSDHGLLLFGSSGLQAFRQIADALKRPGRRGEPAQAPLAQALQQAQVAVAEEPPGRSAAAGRRRAGAGEAAHAGARQRAHHLLGWVALKEGQGRRALDHFSQVQGQPVEPHALAAAFSLVGDDARALPAVGEAWRDTGDRTVLHESPGA